MVLNPDKQRGHRILNQLSQGRLLPYNFSFISHYHPTNGRYTDSPNASINNLQLHMQSCILNVALQLRKTSDFKYSSYACEVRATESFYSSRKSRTIIRTISREYHRLVGTGNETEDILEIQYRNDDSITRNANSRKPDRPHPTEFSPPPTELLTFSSGTFMQHEWNKVESGRQVGAVPRNSLSLAKRLDPNSALLERVQIETVTYF